MADIGISVVFNEQRNSLCLDKFSPTPEAYERLPQSQRRGIAMALAAIEADAVSLYDFLNGLPWDRRAQDRTAEWCHREAQAISAQLGVEVRFLCAWNEVRRG